LRTRLKAATILAAKEVPSPPIRVSDTARAFKEAVALHQAGRLDEAEKIYRTTLEIQPNHFGSLHLLGVVAHQRGDHETGLRQSDAAISINSKVADAFFNRATVLVKLNRPDEALSSFDKAIALRSDYAEAFYHRGNTLKGLKRLDEALASYDQAI